MKRKLLAALLILMVLILLPGPAALAGKDTPELPIAVDISHRLKHQPAPAQPGPAEAEAAVAMGATSESQCGGDNSTLTIAITSFDPANPGSQDVVFFKETPAESTGHATLWVAWDFLTTAYGRQDGITCDQLATLQMSMDSIVDTDTYYFGNYTERPAGNQNIDVMIYNIVDETYFDPTFPFYVAGFFWSSINQIFDRNMIFVDTYDWVNRLGPDALHPYLYEGTVAHELEHLIHNDHDADEDSWVDEGMADLSEFLNGFGHPDSHVVYYLAYHRTPLTVWGGGLESYGASYLFQLYLLENFGAKGSSYPTGWDNTWTRTEIDQPANSITGVEAASGADFNTLYDAWILANYLDRPGLPGPGGYPLGYHDIDLNPFVSRAYSPWSIVRGIDEIYGSTHHGNLPVSRYYGGYQSGTVEYPAGALAPYAPLYGLYKGIQPTMNITLRGDAASGVAPHDGVYEAASGGSNMLIDRMLQLNTPVGGSLTFWTWFDIEEEWDYGFVEASTNGGVTWAPLSGSITRTSFNPNNSTAWANSLVGGQASTDAAITGSSNGWVQATFNLPAADNVLVRFSYYTDEATVGQGWFIDQISSNGFLDSFEGGAGNWNLGGWQWTTGLFDNDWLAAYINPVYNDGKFQQFDYGYIDNDVINGNREFEIGSVDTNKLNKDAAVVVISNRPGESPFSGNYLNLVDKGPATP